MSDQKESRETRPREKITLDTVIPPLPSKTERLPQPDEDRFEREVKNVEAKISKLRDKKKGVNDQIKVKIQGGKMENQDLSVKDFIDSKVTSRKEKFAARGKLRDELSTLKHSFFEMIDEQKRIRPKIKIFDVQKTQNKIDEIQKRIETTSLTLQEEKKLIFELSELQISLPLIDSHNTRAKMIDDNKAKQEVLKKQIEAISLEIDDTNAVIDDTHAKIKSSKDQRDTEIPQMKKEREAIDKEIEEFEAERKKLFDDMREKRQAYKKQQSEIKQIEWMTKMKQRLVDQEERRKKDEERAKLEEENKPHPYANEILSCDAFVAYLNKYVPKGEEERKESGNSEKNDYLPNKVDAGAKESEQWFGAVTKKEKKGRKKVRKPEGITHPIDLLNFFSLHGLKVPHSGQEIKESILKLNEMKNHWEKLDTREEVKESNKKKEDAGENKGNDVALNPVDFPAPAAVERVESFGIFVDQGPRPAQVEENVRGRRGKRRGGRK
jgi:uncharacterized coiled-coil DUF342 family protein